MNLPMSYWDVNFGGITNGTPQKKIVRRFLQKIGDIFSPGEPMRKCRKASWWEKLILSAFNKDTMVNLFKGDYCSKTGQVSEFTHHEEEKHKQQKKEEGTLPYMATWMFQFAKGLIKYKDSKQAYHSVTYEKEAKEYAAEKSGTPYNPPELKKRSWEIPFPTFKIRF